MLPHYPLGSTGLSASPLGLGTVKWGRTEGLKHAAFDLPSDAVIESLLDTALAAGVNVLDTAPAYGIAEERLGKRLGSRRDRFLLMTKTGEDFSGGVSSWNFSAGHTRRSVEASLQRLRTDRLDVVLLHCPRNDLEVLTSTPALETLAELKAEGKVRAAGVSVMSLEGGLHAVPHCDVVMVAWNPGFHAHEPVIAAAAECGTGLVLKKVLSSGSFAGNAGDSIRAALALPGHPVVIAGTISPAHLKENILAAQR